MTVSSRESVQPASGILPRLPALVASFRGSGADPGGGPAVRGADRWYNGGKFPRNGRRGPPVREVAMATRAGGGRTILSGCPPGAPGRSRPVHRGGRRAAGSQGRGGAPTPAPVLGSRGRRGVRRGAGAGAPVILCPTTPAWGSRWPSWDAARGDAAGRHAAIDEALAAALTRALPELADDESAHRFEHSLEVHLPLSSASSRGAVRPRLRGTADLGLLLRLGDALASGGGGRRAGAAGGQLRHDPLRTAPDARRKDTLAVERMETLDPAGLAAVVRRESISMCGWAPAVAVMARARNWGRREADSSATPPPGMSPETTAASWATPGGLLFER